MKLVKFELTQNGQHIGSCGVKEQAIKAAKGYAESHKSPVTVTAYTDKGDTRDVIYHEDGRIEKVWNIESSVPFCPVEGIIYRNAGGGEFKCTHSGVAGGWFVNIKSGWKCLAHGCRQYSDGSIEWDYSTDGHFTNLKGE